MGWKDDERAHHEAVLEELQRVRAAMEDLRPPIGPYEPPVTAQGDFGRFPGLALSVRLCRYYEGGTTLLQMLVPVPREHRGGPHGLEVRCMCGSVARARTALDPCPGDCGRWFVGDESGVWAVKLPAQDDEPVAA